MYETNSTTCPLWAMAQRARQEPFFLGHQLERYRLRHGLTDADLMHRLGCHHDTLTRVFLCRAIANEADVQAVAATFSVSADFLREVVADASREDAGPDLCCPGCGSDVGALGGCPCGRC